MSLGKMIRGLLLCVTLGIVAWSFGTVGARFVGQWIGKDHRKVELTILHWGDPAENSIVQALTERYMADHPDVRVLRIQSADFRPKLKTMMAAGTPPDLFYLPTDLLPELATLKLIRPVDDFVAERQTATGGQYLKDYFPLLLDAFRYNTARAQVGSGPLYGLPKDFTTAVFYVDLDLFERAGVPVPYDGWTWDEFEADTRKITALNNLPEFRGRQIYGSALQLWPDTIRNILWSYGGEFFGKDFRDVTLDQPPAQEALEMIVRTRFKDHTMFNSTGIAKDGGQEFINGNIGCTGPVGRWLVPTYSDIRSFRWDVVPVPCKTKQNQSSQIFTTAWTMSSRTAHPHECFKLMEFLCGPDGAAMQSRLGLAIPPLRSIANSKDFLEPPGLPRHHSQIFLDAIGYARLGQIPREAEWTQIVTDKITRSIQLGSATPLENAREIKAAWLAELDSPLRQREWGPMHWGTILTLAAAALATAVMAIWWRERRDRLGPLDRAHERAGWAFIAPWLIGFLSLALGPMLFSLLLSFTKWSAMTPIAAARSVGGANYFQLFTSDSTFYTSLKVTLYFVVLAVPVGQVASLAVALLMNSKVRGITFFRTIYFVPSVVSGVALAVLWLQIFNNDYGLLNRALRPLLKVVGALPPDWFGRDAKIWAIPAFVIMGLWGVGGGMIIYLAGLKGIPASLYEAATIDGAGPTRKFWNVTLPMLSPLIFYNMVMGIIGSFQVFTQAYVMTGAGPDNATLFYVLNLYRQAFEFHNMGYASAMAWVLFLIVLGLTVLIFRGSRSLIYYEGLKT